MFIILSLIFIVIANLTLGAVVFNARRNSVGKLFFLFTVFISGWLATNALADNSIDKFYATLWTKVTMIFGIGIPWVILTFSLVFPDKRSIHKNTPILTIPFILISLLLASTGLVVESAERVNNIAEIKFGALGSIYGLVFLGYFVAALVIFFLKLRKSKGVARAQLFYFLSGLSLTFIIGTITNLLLPLLFNSYALSPFGAFSTIFVIAFTAYAIIAHQLFDIRVIIKRTVVYSGLLGFTLGIYSLIVFVFTSLFGGESAFSTRTFLPNFIAAIFIAIGFEPIRRWLTSITDKYLFKGEYNPQEVLAKLSTELSNSVDIRQAAQTLVTLIKTELRLSHAAVITFSEEEGRLVVKEAVAEGYDDPAILQLQDNSFILQQFTHSPQTILTEVLRRDAEAGDPKKNPALATYQHLLSELSAIQAAVTIPITVNKKVIGIFLVGEKLSGDIFTKNEIEFLTIVANQTANAIEKARFWEEDQMKSEFVSIASHELLTPTAAMKGYLSMILDDHMGEVDPTARQFLEKVSDSTNRLAALVEDLLNVSRIESGRLKINKKAFSLVESVKKATDELQVKAKEKSLDLAFVEPQEELPLVFADPDHVYRVLVNLIGNSIKYTPKGWTRCFVSRYNHHYLSFIVSDSGLGIPKNQIPHLFEKFNRADRKEIAGIQGTGLGLYVSKKIIDMMGGQMWVESEQGKGSTFYFTIPLATEEQTTASQALLPQANPAPHAQPQSAAAPAAVSPPATTVVDKKEPQPAS